ncbi:23S rRNA (guanine(745)-N(1))-methyltransferase [Agarivorans sp. Toyoura001]|uniref:23S rRNA (guanine(745)-N(1))-methyltransferase n=1 Tax=Agarivorans sp. Toyoura001 TaxID=2283141 RepID=UPI0010D7EFD1|nr:23S rRNA (guanine(745)-N(1))-methyltransferase [Agarivorans sp. Toyoura001]GDY25450.1 23S rRNA (guanine(745)-N(1))-methyltransferase [Agarivorans sp. Toyoura001]
MIICPICQAILSKQHKQWSCENGHCFDQAKEGYTNLLAVQHKHSKQPGDSKAMLQARQHFLNQGHFAFLAKAINQALTPFSVQHILDIGCGEGYYTDALCQGQKQAESVTGIDIAKDGIRMAAKRCQQAQFFVASNHRLPIADNSVDCVMRVFAPSDEQELLRVSKPGAYLLKVVPGAQHLSKLRQLLYKELQAHSEQAETMQGWRLVEQKKIAEEAVLNRQDMEALCMMTPFAWKKNQQLEQQLAAQSEFEMNFEFVLQIYQRD